MLSKREHNETSSLEKVVTPSSLVIIDGDIVKTYTNPDDEFDEDAVTKNLEAIWNLTKDRKIFSLVAPDPSTYVSISAKTYELPKFDIICKGQAFVVKTLGHRILAQFYKIANKKKDYPVKVFDSEEKALIWFEKLRNKNA